MCFAKTLSDREINSLHSSSALCLIKTSRLHYEGQKSIPVRVFSFVGLIRLICIGGQVRPNQWISGSATTTCQGRGKRMRPRCAGTMLRGRNDGAVRRGGARNGILPPTAERLSTGRPAGVSFASPRCVRSWWCQYSRKPAWCHAITVRGVTRTKGFCHPDQRLLKATQNSSCRGDSPWTRRVQRQQLLTESEILKHEIPYTSREAH